MSIPIETATATKTIPSVRTNACFFIVLSPKEWPGQCSLLNVADTVLHITRSLVKSH
jgi:hypothetical protein